MSSDQILVFLDEFRLLHSGKQDSMSRLISLKVPETLLRAFKTKAHLKEIRYQTQIKKLMQAWVMRTSDAPRAFGARPGSGADGGAGY